MSASPTGNKELVLVTGATGFIASHIIKVLVERNYRVRATVRKLSEKARYEPLYDICGDKDRTLLEFVEVDLESEAGKWDDAVKDCVACIHAAGPVKLSAENVDKELLDPILKGVANVFGACHRSGTVKRVVFTSSVTALSDSFEKWRTHEYNEDDWNTVSSKKRNVYAYAKTVGERAAIEFARLNKSFSLACVLPYTVMGPMLLKTSRLPETMDLPIRGSMAGQMWLIDYNFGISDVRDTALVHVAAMEHLPLDFSDQGDRIPRYIVWNGSMKFKTVLKVIAEAVPERKSKLPRVPLPNWLVLTYMRTLMPKGVYIYVSSTLRNTPKFDVKPIKDQLGITMRAPEETIRDAATYIKEAGFLKN